MRLPQPRFTVRQLMIAVAVLGMLMGIVLPVTGAVMHGPYALWFNHDCQRRADEAGLIGRPERDVISVLGQPTFIYEFNNSAGTRRWCPRMIEWPLARTILSMSKRDRSAWPPGPVYAAAIAPAHP
jgi:hypothetical protein